MTYNLESGGLVIDELTRDAIFTPTSNRISSRHPDYPTNH